MVSTAILNKETGNEMFVYSTLERNEAIAFWVMSVILYKELVLCADECCWLFQGGEMTLFSPAELPLLLLRSS
jgi:hypothetical protein